MTALIEIILPVFMVMGLGYLSVFSKFMTHEAVDGLMKFSMNFAIPMLLFRAISTLDLSQGYDPRLLLSFYSGSVSVFFLGILGARYLFDRPWIDSVVIGFSALFANTVMLGLSIMERAYGPDSLAPNYAIVSLHAPICYFLGITTMEIIRNKGSGMKKTAISVLKAMFSNALMLAICLGFLFNISGLVMPKPIGGGFDLITRAALPTALFSLGAVLHRYRPEGDLRVVIWVCFLSLIVHPSIAYGLTVYVFDLPQGMVQGAVLTAAMAPGINSYVFARLFGRAARVAATSVLSGTVLSVFSVSVWLMILGV